MIYIATHKKFEVPSVDGYVPIYVGAEGKQKLGYLSDNTGENISKKNKNYCEDNWTKEKDNIDGIPREIKKSIGK